MPILTRKKINQKVIDSIQSCGWSVAQNSAVTQTPLYLTVYKENQKLFLKIYIWNLTHGGKSRSTDEYRIQLKGNEIKQENKFKTLLLGWWDDVGVYAGFDVTKHEGKLAKSPSVQIRKTTLKTALENGMSTHMRGNDEIAVAFRPELFMDYVESSEFLHEFGKSTSDLGKLETIIENSNDEESKINDEDVEAVTKKRREVARSIKQKVRDASFKNRVLNAYGNQCAFCSVQLKLIDAAHILPVAHDTSDDKTSNGIALCSLHHRAFDNSLITINEKYETLVNLDRIDYLKSVALDGGKDKFIEDLRPIIHIPFDKKSRPNINYIKQANELRGWKKSKSQVKNTK